MNSFYSEPWELVIFAGKARSGKDTAAMAVMESYAGVYRDIEHHIFALPLKRICIELFGLSERQCFGDTQIKNEDTHILWGNMPLPLHELYAEMKAASTKQRKVNKKTPMKVREVLQIVGTNIFRKIDPDCWVRPVDNALETSQTKHTTQLHVITDARFYNEIDKLKRFNPIVIHFTRNECNFKHSSETSLDNYPWLSIDRFHEINNDMMSIEEKNATVLQILRPHLRWVRPTVRP